MGWSKSFGYVGVALARTAVSKVGAAVQSKLSGYLPALPSFGSGRGVKRARLMTYTGHDASLQALVEGLAARGVNMVMVSKEQGQGEEDCAQIRTYRLERIADTRLSDSS